MPIWKDCELAVRIDGKPYFVDGTFDSHGDAHANDFSAQKGSVIVKTIVF
jgi:hypothetical protein